MGTSALANKGVMKKIKFVKDTSQTSLNVSDIDVKLVNTLNPRTMRGGGVQPIKLMINDLEMPRTAESPTRLSP